MLLNPLLYFTTWTLSALMVPGAHLVMDLPVLVGIMFLGAGYMTLVHPRAYRVFDGTVLKGPRRFLVDLPLHAMPLLYILFATQLAQQDVTLAGLAGTALFVATYLATVGPGTVRWLYML